MTDTKTRTVIRWTALTSMAVLLFYGGLWFALASNIRELSEEWIIEQQRAGWAIAINDVRLDGFPGWPNVVVDKASVTAPMEEGGWSWSAESLTLVPQSLDLRRMTVQSPGRHDLSAPWTADQTWALDADRFDFEFELDAEDRLRMGRVHLANMEVTDPNALPLVGAARLDLSLSLTHQLTRPDAEDTFAQFTSAADAVRLAVSLPPFERVIRTAQLDADLVGRLAPGRLSEALEAWRQGGGTLEVRKVRLDWPPLAITGDGTISLDERLQPIAAFSTRITGFEDTLRALETQGVIPRGQSSSALVILNLLSNTPRGSDTPELSIPVSVQDQRLNVGPFNVMDVPEVIWD